MLLLKFGRTQKEESNYQNFVPTVCNTSISGFASASKVCLFSRLWVHFFYISKLVFNVIIFFPEYPSGIHRFLSSSWRGPPCVTEPHAAAEHPDSKTQTQVTQPKYMHGRAHANTPGPTWPVIVLFSSLCRRCSIEHPLRNFLLVLYII